jgi:predicted transcriptional regulator
MLQIAAGERGEIVELETARQTIATDLLNPEVAAEVARTAVANQLAILVIEYRATHGLTQAALARRLDMKQPAVARLEAGDHEPSVATLARMANKLGLTLRLDLTPSSVALVSS